MAQISISDASVTEGPGGIQTLLNHEFLGVSLLQIGLFACVLLFAWFMAGLISYLVGRFLLRGIVGKFLPRFGIGMDRAVSGPLQLTVLCWLTSIRATACPTVASW